MKHIHEFAVPTHAITMWWLGQSSFLLKSPSGSIIAIDPYLTNSCAELLAPLGLDAVRRYPVLIEPEDLEVACICLTHSHQDHCDSETIRRYYHPGQNIRFIAPGETRAKLLTLNVNAEDIELTWPNLEHQIDDFHIKTMFRGRSNARRLSDPYRTRTKYLFYGRHRLPRHSWLRCRAATRRYGQRNQWSLPESKRWRGRKASGEDPSPDCDSMSLRSLPR